MCLFSNQCSWLCRCRVYSNVSVCVLWCRLCCAEIGEQGTVIMAPVQWRQINQCFLPATETGMSDTCTHTQLNTHTHTLLITKCPSDDQYTHICYDGLLHILYTNTHTENYFASIPMLSCHGHADVTWRQHIRKWQVMMLGMNMQIRHINQNWMK